jgi:hypothetical protein
MNSITAIVTNLLLTAIAVLLFLIWHRMPPSVGEFAAASGEGRRGLIMKQPLVRAVIADTLDVNVVSGSLEVSNTPLEVTITR